jgi:hypothetical protein
MPAATGSAGVFTHLLRSNCRCRGAASKVALASQAVPEAFNALAQRAARYGTTLQDIPQPPL